MELANKLASFIGKGYVIAPAGFGKTHLIALAVNETRNRQLILTHTFAGVHSLKKKLQTLDVCSSKYQIDTIASFTLRLCLAYPKTSNWTIQKPAGEEWNKLYQSGISLLEKEFVKKIIKNSYAGLYVDEYQDCSQLQHKLIMNLANELPCRILGDPLQAIFDFNQTVVDWEKDVLPDFEKLGELEIPWRWKRSGATELGEWLKSTREHLIRGKKIDLTSALPRGLTLLNVDMNDYRNTKRFKVFYNFKNSTDSVIGIFAGNPQSKNLSHTLAFNLAGLFCSIEEIEGKSLYSEFKKFEKITPGKSSLLLAIEFMKKCCTGIGEVLSSPTKKGDCGKVSKATKYPEILSAANNYHQNSNSKNLRNLISIIKVKPEVGVYRRDLLNRFLCVLQIHSQNENLSLTEAADSFQKEFRYKGRPIKHSKQIATTLLIKGLEYDHAIVLDTKSMTDRELYVAITRGSKSLTIITDKNHIPHHH